MTATIELPVPAWPAVAPEADTADRELFLRATFTSSAPKITLRALTESQVLSYTALLSDYAWWVLLQLVMRRGYMAAGFKTLNEAFEISKEERERIEGPWVKEILSKIFDQGRLAGYIARNYHSDAKVPEEPIHEGVESWQRHFHAGLPYVDTGLADLRQVQGAPALLRKQRLEEIRKLMRWEIKSLEQQRQLAVELGV